MNLLAEATGKLVDILSPLESEDRIRVVQASLTLLGETQAVKIKGSGSSGVGQEERDDDEAPPVMSAQGKVWFKKNNVTLDQLEHFLHFDGGKVLPIALPGSATTTPEKVINTYLILGLASFLATDEAIFLDQDARDLCKHFGCFDSSNHSKTYKVFGNRITGSKAAGWKLTAPGLMAALALVRPA